jgi:hypothetical protein
MTEAPDNFETFEQEVFELIAKHYPGAIEGDDIPHASCCAALEVLLGMMLMWRLAKSGEEELEWAVKSAAETIRSTALARFEMTKRLRDEMLPHYVEGNKEVKQ